MQLEATWEARPLRCRVHRNHGFELVASAAPPYLRYAGFEPEFSFGDYDDSLSFRIEGSADVELVWLDLKRYDADLDVGEWLGGRVAELQSKSPAPVLVVSLAGDAPPVSLPSLPGLYSVSLRDELEELGPALLDERRAVHTGTRLSGAACVAAARLIGSRWIPALLDPPLKAVLVDLDHTLYTGVLGEDGPAGVEMTPGHQALQQALKGLRARGLLLGLASRNEPDDVKRLFRERTDFPLRWSDFSFHGVTWDEKGATIEAAAEELRIAPDGMVLVDDNPGELLSAIGRVPDVHCLLAGPSGEDTHAALTYFPGLFKWRRSEEDGLRARDLAVSGARRRASTHDGGGAEYMASLRTELTLRHDSPALVPRAAELCRKTNQFNLTLARLDERQLAEYVSDPSRSLVTVALKDRLSDSGVIAVLAGRLEERTLLLDEVCISCRALGRGIETALIAAACRGMSERVDADSVELRYRPGPRNGPARAWIERLDGVEWNEPRDRARWAPPAHPADASIALTEVNEPANETATEAANEKGKAKHEG